MKNLKKKSNESGIVLLTVVIVSCVMMILVASALDFVHRASDQSYKNYYKQQAYVTAQTTLDAFVGQIDGNANKTTIDSLENLASANAITGVNLDDILAGAGNNAYEFGDCNISLSKNGNVIAITSTATYPGSPSKNGQTQSVTAYVKIDKKNINQKLESALVTNGVDVPYHNNLNVRGGVTTQKFTPAPANTWSYICNGDTYEGKNNFNGAVSLGNMLTFKDDPNHIANGATVTITDFLFTGANELHLESRINNPTVAGSTDDDLDLPANNFMNIYGALAMGGSGAGHVIVGKADHKADLYVSAIMYGTKGLTGTNCFKGIVDSMNAYSSQPTEKGIPNMINDFKGGSDQTGRIEVNGNLFCYNTARTEVDYCDGDVFIAEGTSGSITVNGNAYIEGNIVLATGAKNGAFIINGDLIMSQSSKIVDASGNILFDPSVGGTMPGAVNVTGSITTNSAIQTFQPRNIRPDPADGTVQQYKYSAEQLLLGDVATGDNGVPYYKDYYSADHGITYSYLDAPVQEVDVATNFDSAGNVIATTPKKFKYISGQKVINIDKIYDNANEWNGNIYIEVKDTDVVVLISDTLHGLTADKNLNFFVKNNSAEQDYNVDGEIVKGHEHSCYFVSDSYLGGGNWNQDFYVNVSKFMIIDFDIADNAGYFKNGQFTSGKMINNTDRTSFDLASTSGNAPTNYYDLTSNSIIMILSSGKDDNHISLDIENEAMVNANIFAPNARFRFNGANYSFKMTNKVTGQAENVDHYGGLGQFIVKDLNKPDAMHNPNITTLEMYRANPSSVLSYVLHNSKSADDDYTAYKTIGYSYKSTGLG